MSIFFVTTLKNSEQILDQAKQLVPEEDNRYVLSPDKFFLRFEGTTQDLSEKLKITSKEPLGTGVVLKVGNYFGRAPTNLWEWLTVKPEK